ncbi:peptidoglycan DD-metalloendopeptidase family protein [Sulfurimonas sp. SAG-AH-194-I05]|nr:M23 family metallopeptidase [Sulfurimonas sp. SAG-AH-194-I05]MDF1874658.1 peptidoglycan DD-metalloendopeptidase family protein [Sulfurimonas sp. SAG-AH-194-I05]
MNNHFTVTIHDDNGVKQYNLHHFVKQAIMYALLFLGVVALISVGTILYLNDEVDAIEVKRLSEQDNFIKLQNKNEELNGNILNSQNMLEDKKRELDKMSESLSEIETMIGLSPSEEMPLQKRVDLAKLSSKDMMTLLQFVPNGSPIEYKGITSKFGYRHHPKLDRREFHRGTDMKAKMKTPVYATADALVEYAGMHKKSGYGRLVILQHNYGFKTLYGHLNKVVIKSGRFVKKGDLIAYTGNTGLSSGPHLHYEVRFKTRPINPFWFIKWNAKNYNAIFKKEKKVPWQSLITAMSHIKVVKPIRTQQ